MWQWSLPAEEGESHGLFLRPIAAARPLATSVMSGRNARLLPVVAIPMAAAIGIVVVGLAHFDFSC